MGSMVFLTNVSLEIYTLPPLSSKILFTNLLACKLSGYTSTEDLNKVLDDYASTEELNTSINTVKESVKEYLTYGEF